MRGVAVAALGATLIAVLVLLGSLIFGIGRAGGEIEQPLRPAVDPARPRIRVEVLNAAGVPRLAQRATERLRDSGFDVVHYGNARGFHPDSSLVLDRIGQLSSAQAVARSIGISRVRARPDSTLYLEVTVILGRDWQGIEETRPDR